MTHFNNHKWLWKWPWMARITIVLIKVLDLIRKPNPKSMSHNLWIINNLPWRYPMRPWVERSMWFLRWHSRHHWLQDQKVWRSMGLVEHLLLALTMVFLQLHLVERHSHFHMQQKRFQNFQWHQRSCWHSENFQRHIRPHLYKNLFNGHFGVMWGSFGLLKNDRRRIANMVLHVYHMLRFITAWNTTSI